ncbi:MAG: DUF4397 domain-containing protein [Bradymonadales bacterium]|nr:DUF4397 domain-containing protein [Bradymonadales bacterium]
MTRHSRDTGIVLSLCLALVLSVSGCSEDGGSRVCDPGATQLCYCAAGILGAQQCREDGSGWGSCDCGGSDAGVDVGGDYTGQADPDTDAGAAQFTEVCGEGYEMPSFHPSSGTATVVLSTFGLDSDRQIDLDGPSPVAMSPGHGCHFTAEPGSYVVRVTHEGTVELTAEVDLPEGETSLLAIYGSSTDSGAIVVPLDLSVPPAGQWRATFLHLAQDNVDTPLDVHAYGPGLWAPEGTPERIVEAMEFGEAVAVLVPAHSLVYEIEPTGTTTDGTLYTRAFDCLAPAFVLVAVAWCDTGELGGDSPCTQVAGPAWFGYSVEDEPCGG